MLFRSGDERELCDLLIVDDDPVMLAMFSRIGRRLNLTRIELAQGVKEMEQKFELYCFRLVFLDHLLIDGFGNEALQSDGVKRGIGKTGIIVASGFDPERLRPVYAPFRVKHILRKPIQPHSLSVAIVDCLSGAR